MISLGMMKLLDDRWCSSPFPLLVVIMRSILITIVYVTDAHQPIDMWKLLDNSLSTPEYSVHQAILSIRRDLLNDAYSRLIN